MRGIKRERKCKELAAIVFVNLLNRFGYSSCKWTFLFCNILASIDVNTYIYDIYIWYIYWCKYIYLIYIDINIYIFKGNRHQLDIDFLLIYYLISNGVHELAVPLLTILFYPQLIRLLKNLALKNVTWTLNYHYYEPWKNFTYSFSKHPIFLPSLLQTA